MVRCGSQSWGQLLTPLLPEREKDHLSVGVILNPSAFPRPGAQPEQGKEKEKHAVSGPGSWGLQLPCNYNSRVHRTERLCCFSEATKPLCKEIPELYFTQCSGNSRSVGSILFSVPEIRFRASCMLGKHSSTELQYTPSSKWNIWGFLLLCKQMVNWSKKHFSGLYE